jgi:pimeloyl-ACP methyl ester carboxylesterase
MTERDQVGIWRSLRHRMRVIYALMLVSMGIVSSGFVAEPAYAQNTAREAAVCPSFLPNSVTCFQGNSAAGAHFLIAKPRDWNGTFILFAHGGPRLGPPQLSETVEDLEKFQSLVRAGYAWAGTTYRRGGYGVRSAAVDIEDLRAIVWHQFGRPKLTLLHGQSWGGNVAAKVGELYALDVDGNRNYDGIVLTSAVLAGGTRAYQIRADLRAVFQYYCQNHPGPDEPAYPVWQGLAPGMTMNRTEIARRLQTCTGVGLPQNQRTELQRKNLRNIMGVLGLAEDQILPNLVWATNTFQDLVGRLGGKNPFSNNTTTYRGSRNDRALNAGIARFSADTDALAQLAFDSDLSGLIVTPTITLHGLQDPVARVCHQSAYAETVEKAGRGQLLMQIYTSEAEHSRLAAPAYPAVFNAVVNWVETKSRPQLHSVVSQCRTLGAQMGEPCRIVTQAQVPKWPC